MSNYLSYTVRLPLAPEAAERLLAEPFPLPSAALRERLDALLLPLCAEETESLCYFADAQWIDAHLAHFCQHSCRTVLGLIDRQLGGAVWFKQVESDSPATGPAGYYRQCSEITHMAFMYAEAAIAEHLAAAIPDELAGLLHIDTQSSSSGSLDILLNASGFKPTPKVYWYDRHPLHNWLSQHYPDDQGATWPGWEALLAEPDAGQRTAIEGWQAFTAAQRRQAIDHASPEHPILLGACHSTDGQHVYFGRVGDADARRLDGCDPYTFRNINDGEGVGNYGADRNSLWSWGKPLPCKNPAAFGPLKEYSFFFTDGHYVYSDDEVLPDVVADEIRPVDGDQSIRGFVWRDRFYTRYGGWTYFDITGQLRALSYDHLADATDVCLLEGNELLIIDDFDPATAFIVETEDHRYLCDAERVGYIRANNAQPRLIKGAKGAHFRRVADLPFVTDGQRVWLGEKVCKDLAAGKLQALPAPAQAGERVESAHYFRCGDAIGYIDRGQYQWLAEAHAASFECLGEWLARDAQHTWYGSEIVADADPASFAWINRSWGRWRDARQLYVFNEAMPLDSIVYEQGMVFRLGCYHFDGLPVSGWTGDTHKFHAFGCIEDDRYFYTWRPHEGGHLSIWEKPWSARPINDYHRDEQRTRWQAAPLDANPWPEDAPLLSDEEFDTLLESVPPAMSQGMVTTWKNPPLSITRQTEPYRRIQIEAPIRCTITRDPVDQHFDIWMSSKSRNMTTQARRLLERALADALPASIELLDDLIRRIPPDDTLAEFEIAGGNLQIQDGRDNLRGAWLSLRQSEQQMRRLAIWTNDDGFLGGCNLSAPIALWDASTSDERFTGEVWTAELRLQWRNAINQFLADVPAQRQAAKKSGKAQAALTKKEMTHLCELLAPTLSGKERSAMVSALNQAQTAAPDPDLADTKWGKPGAQLWEELLDQLENHGLLHGFDKQQPLDATDACNALAQRAGIDEHYTPSDDCGNDSFFDVAQDFTRWLAPRSYTLLWPQGSLRWDGDDIFPAVIVPTANTGEIDQLVGKLGGYARFSRMP